MYVLKRPPASSTSTAEHHNRRHCSLNHGNTYRRPSVACQAKQKSKSQQATAGPSPAGMELLEAIEQKERGTKSEAGAVRDAFSMPDQETPAPAPPPKKKKKAVVPQGPAEWREGKLFPEGWEKLNIFQKAYELYLGQRGLLFWINKSAYASIFIIIFAWVVFRFVLPGIGLYQLENDLSSPPVQ